MHSYCSFMVRYIAGVLLLCSGMQLHAAAKPTAEPSGHIPKMQISAGCRQNITELKQEMIMFYRIAQGMFKELAQAPGLRPSNVLDLFSPEEFVIRLRSLQRMEPAICHQFLVENKAGFDRTFTQVLGNTGNADAAWQHVDDALQEKILELSNDAIPILARICECPSTASTYIDSSLLLSAHQLHGGPVVQIEQTLDQ